MHTKGKEPGGRKLAKVLLGGTPNAVGLVVAAVVGTAIGNLLTRYVLYALLAVAAYALAMLGLYYGETIRRWLATLRRPAERQPAVVPEPKPAWRARGRTMAVICLLGACGYVLGYWVVGQGFAHDPGLGIGSLLVILAVVAAVMAALRRRRGGWPRWLRRRARTGLACGMIAAALSAGATLGGTNLAPPCPAPVELRVLTSSDDLGAVQAAIPGFEQFEPGHLHTACYVVDVTAYAAPSDSAAWSGLKASWGPAELSGDGPRPDIWIPGSSAELAQAAGGPELTGLGSIASSPLVVAVPDELVSKYSLSALAAHATWGGLVSRLQEDGIGLAMPNPKQSESAQLQLAGLFPVLDPAEQRVIEGSGSFPADSGNLLCGAAQAAEQDASQARTAYLVSEAALINGNAGQLTEGACATLTGQPPPLTAFYVDGAAALDFPFMIVNWAGSAAAPSQYERDFFQWLTSRAASGTLAAWGLRPPGCGQLAAPPPGIAASIAGCPQGNRPAATEVTGALNGFGKARAPVDVLIGIDDSGPMEPYLPGITAAVDAELGQGGTHVGRGDSFGIWSLPGPGKQTEKRMVPFGPAESVRSQVAGRLGVLKGHDHSANYDMLADAAGLLYAQPSASPEPVSSVILLTDGDGYAADPGGHNAISVAGTFDRPPAGHSPIRLYIIAFGPAGCAETGTGLGSPSLSALANATGGICLQAGGSDPRQLLAQVLSQISAGG